METCTTGNTSCVNKPFGIVGSSFSLDLRKLAIFSSLSSASSKNKSLADDDVMFSVVKDSTVVRDGVLLGAGVGLGTGLGLEAREVVVFLEVGLVAGKYGLVEYVVVDGRGTVLS